jgi:hypothetical protein
MVENENERDKEDVQQALMRHLALKMLHALMSCVRRALIQALASH